MFFAVHLALESVAADRGIYFWAGQYIGDICEGCEMNGNCGRRRM
jgi:hypothetical protein